MWNRAASANYYYNIVITNTGSDPIPVKVMSANLPKDHYVQDHENTLLTLFQKLSVKRSITLNDP